MKKLFPWSVRNLLVYTVLLHNSTLLLCTLKCLFFYCRFDIDSPEFFTPTVRSRIVQFILDRTLFSLNELDPTNFGIEHLINDDVYCAAYPLHEVII